MPLSNDNQDFGKNDEKNKDNKSTPGTDTKMTSDDLKGKQQVDGDIEKESDRPQEQESAQSGKQ